MIKCGRVLVVMGSMSDSGTVLKCTEVLKSFDVDFECHVVSAHRTPDAAIALAKSAKDEGFSVVICAAGMAAHLAGVFAANTTLPVIGLPLSGGIADGMDALLSTVQMPSGFPVATVAVNGAKNAAYLAISILALSNDSLSQKLQNFRETTANDIKAKDEQLQTML